MSILYYFQKAAFKHYGCGDCPVAKNKLYGYGGYEPPERCRLEDIPAFYCPITGSMLGAAKGIRGYFIDESE